MQDVNLFDPLLSLQINHVCGKKMHEWKRETDIWYHGNLWLGNIPGYLMTIDFKKALDSLDHGILLCVLKTFGFGIVKWSCILWSCVTNWGFAT